MAAGRSLGGKQSGLAFGAKGLAAFLGPFGLFGALSRLPSFSFEPAKPLEATSGGAFRRAFRRAFLSKKGSGRLESGKVSPSFPKEGRLSSLGSFPCFLSFSLFTL